MGKIAFLFPGQGAQYVGMAKDVVENSESSKELVKNAEEAINFDLTKIMFDGPVDDLKQTSVTQPAIFLHSVLLTKIIKNIKPDMAAGHSLGEYSALVAAGALEFIDAMKLVRFRGEAMLQAGIDNPGTMAAVVGMQANLVEEMCNEASSAGIVQCANFNSPGQIVISGSVDGVHKAMELCKSNGAKLVKELVVSGAFHSPLMQSAKDKLGLKLEEVKINDANIPVYANVTAKPVTVKNEIKDLLNRQVTAPVRWEETIKNMIDDGADEFYEIGPGKVLQGLLKRINPNVKSVGIDKYSDLEKLF
ncbi:MAG: ACP S-malonyltransferase [Ignavibacteriae bacterium]|nr:[acyl-carrier-protein] S-malonyltransferase [Ignavibacteriota bacterium]NOG98721.1 ACP S-malonyltransferase [Ignavibacteriota bacterium]